MSIKQVPLQAKNVNSRGTFDTSKVNDKTIKPLKSRSDQVVWMKQAHSNVVI